MLDVLKNNHKFTLMAGPCVIEDESVMEETACFLTDITKKLDIDFYFKASFDKANRTRADKFRGPGLDEGLKILKEIKKKYKCKIITDIHEGYQAEPVSSVADIIQIPAFLCRQTSILEAAAKTNKIINVKKAQFITADDMKNVASKLEYYGNNNILLCERGTCFGYNYLVVDMIGLAKMRSFGYPVVFDATHSVQIPGVGENNSNSGQSEYVQHLARAAAAVGIDALFMEVHPEPQKALCDASCMVKLDDLEDILKDVLAIRAIVER